MRFSVFLWLLYSHTTDLCSLVSCVSAGGGVVSVFCFSPPFMKSHKLTNVAADVLGDNEMSDFSVVVFLFSRKD